MPDRTIEPDRTDDPDSERPGAGRLQAQLDDLAAWRAAAARPTADGQSYAGAVTDPAARPHGRRRAVGPRGAEAGEEPRLDLAPPPAPADDEDDERLRRDRPPHHDQGV